VSLDQLAKHSGLSRRHFARLFRELFGTSPMDYVLAARLERSVRMLRETARPVSAVAYACGFNDSNYFSRAFRARYGIAPRFARGTQPS
jgi:transcriptional regulator GlxA family with amidase domain